MRCDGRTSRKLSRGTRLCPPASTLAPSPCWASRASASSTDPGAKYSNRGGFIVSLLSERAADAASLFEDLHLHGGAVVAITGRQHVERTVREADDQVHLGAELDVVAGLGHRFADDPPSTAAVVVVVHEEVHGVGNVLGQEPVGLHGVGDVLVAAVEIGRAHV